MRKSSYFLLCILTFLASLALTSCAPKVVPDRVKPRKTYLTADPVKLLNDLIKRNEKIESIRSSNAIFKYRFTYSTRDYREVDVLFAAKNPEKIYIRGRVTGVGDVFRLMSNGENYWAEVTRDNEVYTGKVDNRRKVERKPDQELWESFDPSTLSEALLIDDLGVYKHRVIETLPDYYIISLLNEKADGGLVIRRRIWIERERLEIKRHRIYNESGELVTEANLFKYTDVDGIRLPTSYRIERYWEELSLRLELSDIKLNSNLRDSLFNYGEVPVDYKLIDLDKREK